MKWNLTPPSNLSPHIFPQSSPNSYGKAIHQFLSNDWLTGVTLPGDYDTSSLDSHTLLPRLHAHPASPLAAAAAAATPVTPSFLLLPCHPAHLVLPSR